MSGRSVSILGCGWLGKVLAQKLETEGYAVACLGRDREENQRLGQYACDTLVIAIPPRENYLAVLEETLGHLKRETQVILLGSTSYYRGKELVVTGEELVRRLWQNAVVLRLGGLMGIDRIAGRYTAGRSLAHDSMSNYIHRDDAVGVIVQVIEQGVYAEIWDVVAPVQYPKSQIFAQNAERFGFEETGFESSELRGEVHSSEALQERLGYVFIHPDVLDFWY